MDEQVEDAPQDRTVGAVVRAAGDDYDRAAGVAADWRG
jgi:hypothetical protein